ncbi:MAG TPA: hypothetical protein VIQ99_07410, partial [Gammaproteobacteria bacterium]
SPAEAAAITPARASATYIDLDTKHMAPIVGAVLRPVVRETSRFGPDVDVARVPFNPDRTVTFG